MKSLTYLLAFFLFTFPNSFADAKELGGGAGDIWTFGAGARSLGLANASVELADDATAGYWNPSRLSYISKMNFNFLHAGLFEGGNYDYLGWAYPMLSAGTLGLNMVRMGIGAIEQRDDNNNLVGNYSFTNQGIAVSYGHQFGAAFAIGGNLKHLTRTLPGASSSLYSFDLAADWKAFKFGEVGLVMRDVLFTGTNTSDRLPMNMTLGASYGLFEGALKLTGQLEQRGPVLRAGLEYGIGPASLRLGLGGSGLPTAGLGMRYGNIQLDYAILMHDLGNSNRFSMGYWFGDDRGRERKDVSRVWADRAMEAYRDGRYIKASRYMDQALALNITDALLSGRRERIGKILAWFHLTDSELRRPGRDAGENPQQKFTYTLRGLSDYVEANVDGALLLLRQALSMDPKDETLRNIHDSIAVESGKVEEKNKPLLSPKANVGIKLAESDRFFRQGRFDLAARACEDAIKLNPGHALSYERLGSSYFALGLKDQAIEMWKKSLEINPNNTALRQFITNFFKQQK